VIHPLHQFIWSKIQLARTASSTVKCELVLAYCPAKISAY